MSDNEKTKAERTHAEQQAERQRERDRAQAEADAARAPGGAKEHDVTTDNRRGGRENTAIPEHTREPPPPVEPAPFGANPKPPLKILNIDGPGNGGASWIDFSEPAPMELLQTIYENSRDGPVTIWSRHLVEPDFAAMLWNWLLEADNAWRSRTLSMQLWSPPTEVPPQGPGLSEVSFSVPAAKPAPAATPAAQTPAARNQAAQRNQSA